MISPSLASFAILPAFGVWVAVLSARALAPLQDDRPGRLAGIDGLRGILAIAVLAHHFAITAQYQATGAWQLTPSRVSNLLGQAAVALFFMITGFLFFGKIASPAGLRPLAFLKGRVVRLVPVYLAVVALVSAIVLFVQGGRVEATLADVAREYARWMACDVGPLLGFADAGRVVAYVPWSLRYEWLFYALLPPIGFAWRRTGLQSWPVYLGAAVALVLAIRPVEIPLLRLTTLFLAPFALGGCVAVAHARAPLTWLRGKSGALVALAALVLLFGTQTTAYSALSYLLLTLVFAPIAARNSLFGLLDLQATQILGAISYDLYLAHGVVLYVLYGVIAPKGLANAGAWGLFAQLVLTGFVAIAVAVALHLAIEKPCLRYGSRFARLDLRERLAAP
jgi:peptidoglycan/LPS O-acetylase OafA/YrhL